MGEKYKLIQDLLNEYDDGNKYDYYHHEKPFSWTKEPSITIADILPILRKLNRDKKNIFRILDALPEETIQEYIRAKKLAKINEKR